jgi:acetyl esterase/lipase
MSTALPRDVIARLTALDPALGPELVQGSWAVLTPFHENAGYRAPRIERDLRYGEHERHRLDIHLDAVPGRHPRPVLLFVHGGGFVGGDKVVPGTPMYDYVGAWAARNGWACVTMTYRLAPGHTWPAGAQDVAAAVAWVRAGISAYGGDPDRITVVGHSAGAVHVAGFIAGQGGTSSLDGVRGAALLSGIYDLSGTDGLGKAYFGDHPAGLVSSLPRLLDTDVPLLFSVAERDPAVFHAQAATLVAAWQARNGALPNIAYVPGHNHISEIASLGVDDEALGAALARFVNAQVS